MAFANQTLTAQASGHRVTLPVIVAGPGLYDLAGTVTLVPVLLTKQSNANQVTVTARGQTAPSRLLWSAALLAPAMTVLAFLRADRVC